MAYAYDEFSSVYIIFWRYTKLIRYRKLTIFEQLNYIRDIYNVLIFKKLYIKTYTRI